MTVPERSHRLVAERFGSVLALLLGGSVGMPLVPQAAATGLEGAQLSGPTALLHLLVGWILLVAMVLVASKATSRPARGAIWAWTALAAAAFLVPLWAIARFVGPELPTLGGALVGAVIFVGALIITGRRGGTRDGFAPSSSTSEIPPVEPTASRTGPQTGDAGRNDQGHPWRDTRGDKGHTSGSSLLLAASRCLVLIVLVLVCSSPG